MIARLEIGEVLLTTSMREVFLRFGETILPRYAAVCELHTEWQSGRGWRAYSVTGAERDGAKGEIKAAFWPRT